MRNILVENHILAPKDFIADFNKKEAFIINTRATTMFNSKSIESI